jgi:hypothetical protein
MLGPDAGIEKFQVEGIDMPMESQLNRALTSDPDHIIPGATGDHVATIQIALSLLGAVVINQIERDKKTYGVSTAAAVKAFKANCSPPLLNFKNEIDDITGKKTTQELDRRMKVFEKDSPVPPSPAPLAAGVGDVQIGPVGPRREVIDSYYNNCGLETIGPARIGTAGLRSYSTFEGLIDLLLFRTGFHQVIVNHGGTPEGLLVRWCMETNIFKTGETIDFFTKLAEALERGTANKSNPVFQDSMETVKFMLSVSEDVVLRIARKLVALRKKVFILHFRACNISVSLAQSYKRALGAKLITFHPIRLIFLRVKPVAFKQGQTPALFPFINNTNRDRARVFFDSLGELSTLVVAVRDLDGHTQVFDFSFVERLVPSEIHEWAKTLIGTWRGSQAEFVIPVMWDNNERSWSCPVEQTWSEKLQFV